MFENVLRSVNERFLGKIYLEVFQLYGAQVRSRAEIQIAITPDRK